MTRDEAIYLLKQIYTGNPNDKDALEIAIRSLETLEKLYEETAEWEAQALDEVRKHIHDEDAGEWRRWSHILNERTAFKFDVMKHLKEVEDDKG